jgi:hypothetical protein
MNRAAFFMEQATRNKIGLYILLAASSRVLTLDQQYTAIDDRRLGQ